MKVVILGFGAVGSVLARLLSKEKEVEKIICCDIKFNFKIKNKKVSLKYLNILDKQKFLDFLNKTKPDVVVNTSLPKFNLDIMEICLKAKVNYLDTASFWDLDPNSKARVPYKMEQLEYNSKFKEAGIIGLIDSGVAPGSDNLITAECASKLDETDYIKIRMVEDTGSKEIFFSWNKDWLLDELNWKPLIYQAKKFKLVENFGGEEEFTFPKPIGKKKVYYFAQDEVGSIPLNIKTKRLDVKIHDNNIEVSKLLVALKLTSENKVNIDGMKIAPIRLLSKILPDSVPGEEKKFPKAVFAIAVEAIGKFKGRKKNVKYSVIFPDQKQIEKMNLNANFISYPTALSIKLFIMAIPKITKTGVFPPECLDKDVREEIIKNLGKNKIKLIKN